MKLKFLVAAILGLFFSNLYLMHRHMSSLGFTNMIHEGQMASSQMANLDLMIELFLTGKCKECINEIKKAGERGLPQAILEYDAYLAGEFPFNNLSDVVANKEYSPAYLIANTTIEKMKEMPDVYHNIIFNHIIMRNKQSLLHPNDLNIVPMANLAGETEKKLNSSLPRFIIDYRYATSNNSLVSSDKYYFGDLYSFDVYEELSELSKTAYQGSLSGFNYSPTSHVIAFNNGTP